jgi:hypothetical protein
VRRHAVARAAKPIDDLCVVGVAWNASGELATFNQPVNRALHSTASAEAREESTGQRQLSGMNSEVAAAAAAAAKRAADPTAAALFFPASRLAAMLARTHGNPALALGDLAGLSVRLRRVFCSFIFAFSSVLSVLVTRTRARRSCRGLSVRRVFCIN